MLAFILIVGVLIAIYFIVNSQKRKKEEEMVLTVPHSIAPELLPQWTCPVLIGCHSGVLLVL